MDEFDPSALFDEAQQQDNLLLGEEEQMLENPMPYEESYAAEVPAYDPVLAIEGGDDPYYGADVISAAADNEEAAGEASNTAWDNIINDD